jgi:sugar phosphate isomerase/epimerase
MSVAGFLDFAKELGLDLVQVADNLPLHSLSTSEFARFQQHAFDLGIDIEVGTRGIARDHLRTYLDIARVLDSPILRIVVDTPDHHASPDEVVTACRDVRSDLEIADIVLAIENHDRFTSLDLVRIIEEIGSDHVGICLDTVNSFGALEGPDQVIKTLGPYTANLHVKDFQISRVDHMMGFAIVGTPAGQGRLDIPGLIEELQNFGRDPNTILELWPPLQDTVELTVELERQWAVESIRYLQRVLPADRP